jgi:hypothetical protein
VLTNHVGYHIVSLFVNTNGEYTMYEVTIHGTEELATFCAKLVKEGVTFKAIPNTNEFGVTSYTVTLTGGF